MKRTKAIRAAYPEDARQIAEIYNYYITRTTITFEEEQVSASDIRQRIRKSQAASLPWLVAEIDDNIIGYSYAAKWKERTAYRRSVEVTVYLDQIHIRQGMGTQLYDQLLLELKTMGVHSALAGIALPNDASIRLHEKMGFTKAAHFTEVGFKFNRWIDVGYWQYLFK